VCIDERAFQRASGGDGDLDAAHADRDQGAKFQELKLDRSGSGFSLRKLKPLLQKNFR